MAAAVKEYIVRAKWIQDAANMRKKLKSLSFSKVSGEALGTFLGFLCTKLGGVSLVRMRHKAMHLVLGRLAGRKMWQTCVKSCEA